jgi:hypothetical protein
MSIPGPEDVKTDSINVTVRAFNGVGEVDGIFCIQGTLEFVEFEGREFLDVNEVAIKRLVYIH